MQEFGSGLTEADVPPEKDVGELMSEIAELASDGSSGEPPSAAKEQEDDGASGLQDESHHRVRVRPRQYTCRHC